LIADIKQLPVPLVIETAPEVAFTEQAVDEPAEKLMAPEPLPPEVAAVMPVCPNEALVGSPVTVRVS
jgi:hypothetical protein